ncbi:MAG TPA: methyltransferase domain-containing protein [Gemmatimonadota bacterium]|nr:methyltransferase domain-containing protein [Gemmatimonadota bacterium]
MSAPEYRDFLADAPRVDAFRRAIESTVSAGQLVLDLGTGIGTYAMFAARAGARVLAVEMQPVIDLARTLAADNGLSERITFLRGRLEELDPPELADVLVFEDFSPFLYHAGTAHLLERVRERWLKPSAVSVPRAVSAWLAPVSCPDSYRTITPWSDGQAFGLDVARFSRQLLNDLHPVAWDPQVLLADAELVGRVNPLALDAFSLEAAVRWEAARAGELHGLGLWVELDLAEGVRFSNAPSGRSSGWDQRFLPLAQPVAVQAGEVIEAQVRTLGPSKQGPTWWSWRVRAAGEEQEMDTFRGLPLSLDQVRRASLDHRPALGARGRLRRAALELMDGQHTVGEIARALRERFPEQLSNDAEAYRVVARELADNENHVTNVTGQRPIETSTVK